MVAAAAHRQCNCRATGRVLRNCEDLAVGIPENSDTCPQTIHTDAQRVHLTMRELRNARAHQVRLIRGPQNSPHSRHARTIRTSGALPARAEVMSWQRHPQNVPTASSPPGPVWSLKLPVTVWVSWAWVRPGRVIRRTTPVAVPARPTAKAIPEVVPSA